MLISKHSTEMKIQVLLSVVVVAILAAISGIAHGVVSHRWGAHPDELAAAAELTKTPENFSDWRTLRTLDIDQSVRRMLRCSGDVSRVYGKESTGSNVSVTVLLGPQGEISAHSPEICYSSQNYDILKSREKITIEIDGQQHTFWRLLLKSKRIHGELLSVVYAWRAGSSWEAAESPRWEFASKPSLYKIQLAAVVNAKADSEDTTPCVDFLNEFLPVAEPHLARF